jgi:hypothetical protein
MFDPTPTRSPSNPLVRTARPRPSIRSSTRVNSQFDRWHNLQRYEEQVLGVPGASDVDRPEVAFLLVDGSIASLGRRTLRAAQQQQQQQQQVLNIADLEPRVRGGSEEEALSPEELWLASYFRVSATNGMDQTRRLILDGFYQNLEFLAENIHTSIAYRAERSTRSCSRKARVGPWS